MFYQYVIVENESMIVNDCWFESEIFNCKKGLGQGFPFIFRKCGQLTTFILHISYKGSFGKNGGQGKPCLVHFHFTDGLTFLFEIKIFIFKIKLQ